MNFQRTPCRCKSCGTRKTLKRHPDHYIKIPSCGCGSKNWYIDNYRINIESKLSTENRCDCIAYNFPHRKTSGYCVHGKLYDPSDENQYRELFYQVY